MNKTILVLFLVAIVFGAAGTSFAGSNDKWTVYLKAADSGGSNYLAFQTIFGTLAAATDGPPAETSPANDASNAAGSGSVAVLGCFDLGVGANSNGFGKDQRAPITTGQKIWNLRLWVQSNWTSGNVILTGWNNAGTAALNGSFPVVLKVINDPTGSYSAGTTLYTFTGPGTNPQFTKTFSNTDAIKGGSTYVQLQLIAGTAASGIPEPGSLAAMLSMLGGLSGMTLWRKRRS
jgi:hypothetical protein